MDICSVVNVRGFLVPSISENNGRILFYNTRHIFSNFVSAVFLKLLVLTGLGWPRIGTGGGRL
jgi:hypothetical protein